jgi:2-polyprenyl-3-methyl-5-hydroxy-6-metoxy-1,4-benzoquinol methylase
VTKEPKKIGSKQNACNSGVAKASCAHVGRIKHDSYHAPLHYLLERRERIRPETMRNHNTNLCCSLAALVLFTSLAIAQTAQPKHEPDVPYVPTAEEEVKAMVKLADVKSSDNVFDLGCGDGRIVIAAAREYRAHGVGIDINPERIAEANENAKKAGVASLVRFEENHLFDADIHEASVVTLFLSATLPGMA